MGNQRLVGVLLALLLAPVANGLERYPGAILEAELREEAVVSHRIVLGSLQKINNVLEPELYEFVRGQRHSETYYLAGERRVGAVIRFYAEQLAETADILFQCEGRDCGSSNYWANRVFDSPILYGPEQFQRYLIGRDLVSGNYIAVYVGQRGTRKIYVHIVTLIPEAEELRDLEAAISAALKTTGRYVAVLGSVEDSTDSLVRALVQVLTTSPMSLAVVAHDGLAAGESVSTAMGRTLRLSQLIKQKLVTGGLDPDQIQTYGVGPLAPIQGEKTRIELLVLDQL